MLQRNTLKFINRCAIFQDRSEVCEVPQGIFPRRGDMGEINATAPQCGHAQQIAGAPRQPLCFFMPHLMKAKDYGRKPFILLSVRDPGSWAQSRLKHDADGTVELISRSRVLALDKQDHILDPFDVLGCASDSLSTLSYSVQASILSD